MAGPDWITCVDDWLVSKGFTVEQRQAFLIDFTSYHHYQEIIIDDDGLPIPNPQTRREFANLRYNVFTVDSTNAWRFKVARDAISIEKLVLE